VRLNLLFTRFLSLTGYDNFFSALGVPYSRACYTKYKGVTSAVDVAACQSVLDHVQDESSSYNPKQANML